MSWIGAVALVPGAACGNAGAAPTPGAAAPVLEVRTLDGRRFDLAQLRGKVVVINFWATWCGPCRSEMPQLDAFYRAHRAQGLEMLGLSIDSPADLPEVQRVMARYHYPAAVSAGVGASGFPAPAAIPVTYVIDRAGVLRARLLPGGPRGLSGQALAAAVLPLL